MSCHNWSRRAHCKVTAALSAVRAFGLATVGLGFGLAAAWPPPAKATAAENNPCANPSAPVALGNAQWNGWGRDLDNSRYQPEPALRASDVPKLVLKWAYSFRSGDEFGQPTVVDGRLFIASSAGRIYSLDARSGCTYWTYDGVAGSRNALSIGELGQSRRAAVPKRIKRTLAHLEVIKAPSAVFFGDDSGAVVALDAQRGGLLWRVQVESHPLARIMGAPALYGDRLFVTVGSTEEKASAVPGYACCTFRGSIAALDIASGRILWKSYTVLETPQATRVSRDGVQEYAPAGAAIVSAPTIDAKRSVLYVGTGRSLTSVEQSLTDAVAAFGLNDGKLRWVKQLSRSGELASSGFTASPVLRTLTGDNQILLAGQQSGVLYGIDPDHGGEVLWQVRLSGEAAAAGGIAWGFAADYRNAYVPLSGELAQPANPAGSLSAVNLKTGAVRWRVSAPTPACAWSPACAHGQAQAATVIPGSVFSGSLDGHLRAYSTIDGRVLWDFDTGRTFPARNGLAATGGLLDHGGATVVNGIVYVNSGNSLLAFAVGEGHDKETR